MSHNLVQQYGTFSREHTLSPPPLAYALRHLTCQLLKNITSIRKTISTKKDHNIPGECRQSLPSLANYLWVFLDVYGPNHNQKTLTSSTPSFLNEVFIWTQLSNPNHV